MRLDEALRRPQRGQAGTNKLCLCGNEVMKEEEDLVRRVVCCKLMKEDGPEATPPHANLPSTSTDNSSSNLFLPTSHNHPPTQTQPIMLQRRHSPALAATLLVLLLVPVASFLFPSTPTSHNIGNMARAQHMPLMMTLEEGEGASSTTSTLEVPPLSPAAVEEEVEVEADSKAAKTEASR